MAFITQLIMLLIQPKYNYKADVNPLLHQF